MRTFSRRWVVAVIAVLCCLSMVAPPAGAGIAESAGTAGFAGTAPAAQSAPDNPCVGTVSEPADGTTVISVQGMRFGENGGKRAAKLVGVGPSGEIEWVHQSGDELDVVWGYDVDPMENGNVFVTATARGDEETLLYEFDPETQERVWTERFDLADTHDADLINDGEEILLANMRNYDAESGENEDRIFVYNRTTEEIEWEWHFDDHYDRDDMSANYTDDWSHVNDVDKVAEGEYIVSPRNFDQVIVVNRSTDEIDMKLGEDGDHDTLNKQHNPDYFESDDGTPTVLVADSENDRLVEYEREGDRDWNRTWTLEGDFHWPRDADRLADGDTLVTDSAHSRVVEVNPEGEIVWEFYAPWLVYDAARLSQSNESGGPTASDLNATGTHEIEGSSGLHENNTDLEPCDRRLENVTGWAEGQAPTGTDGSTSEGAMADDTDGSDGADDESESDDGDTSSSDIPGFGPVAALAGLLLALGVGVARRSDR